MFEHGLVASVGPSTTRERGEGFFALRDRRSRAGPNVSLIWCHLHNSRQADCRRRMIKQLSGGVEASLKEAIKVSNSNGLVPVATAAMAALAAGLSKISIV